VHLADVIPNADVLIALEPDELGLLMLPALASWRDHTPLQLPAFLAITINAFEYLQAEVGEAIIEAWTWLVVLPFSFLITRKGISAEA
jgi:hypothetical protein